MFGLNSSYGQIKNFKVTKDTTKVNIEGTIYKALLINNKYYAFFETMAGKPTRRFYILSIKGTIEKEIKLPEEINRAYYFKFQYIHDSLIVTTEGDDDRIYIDLKKSKFTKIENTKRKKQSPLMEAVDRDLDKMKYQGDFLFEDENYYVIENCEGEFGSSIYFKNKKTNITYEASTPCPIVLNKVDNQYYITSSESNALNVFSSISVIADPLKLKVNDRIIRSASTVGVKQVLDTSGCYISSSFAYKDTLYHIFSNEKTTKIGVVKNKQLSPVFDFKEKLEIQLQQHFFDGHQLSVFNTEKNNTFGFLEIKGNQIKMHYFINKHRSNALPWKF